MFTKKKILITVFVICASVISFAQTGKLAGQLTDATTGKPLVGANLSLTGTKIGCATDQEGKYVMLKIPSGTYSLNANYAGYKSVLVQDIKIKSGLVTELNLALRPSGEFEPDSKTEAMYRKNLPKKIIEQLDKIRENDKEKYKKLLQEYYYNNLLTIDEKSTESRQRETKILELNIKAEILANIYKSSKSAEKEKIKTELRNTLVELFNEMKNQRVDDVKYLKSKLELLERSLRTYEGDMNKLVEKKLEEMLNENNK